MSNLFIEVVENINEARHQFNGFYEQWLIKKVVKQRGLGTNHLNHTCLWKIIFWHVVIDWTKKVIDYHFPTFKSHLFMKNCFLTCGNRLHQNSNRLPLSDFQNIWNLTSVIDYTELVIDYTLQAMGYTMLVMSYNL